MPFEAAMTHLGGKQILMVVVCSFMVSPRRIKPEVIRDLISDAREEGATKRQRIQRHST